MNKAEIKKIREDANKLLASSDVIQADIQRETGLNASKLSQFLADKYPGDNSNVALKVSNWVENYLEQSQQLNIPIDPDYYRTETGDKILEKLMFAQALGDISIIYGVSGVCKTSSIEYYRDTHPNVWISTMRPSTKMLMPCVTQIADTLGIKDYQNSSFDISRIIEYKLKKSKGLLIIDEAQNPCIQALDEIRSWHDATGIGIALVGNTQLNSQFTSMTESADELDRLRSRIGAPLEILEPTENDISALLDAWKISDVKARKYITKISKKEGGHLRVGTKLIKSAALYSKKAVTELTLKELKYAWKKTGEKK